MVKCRFCGVQITICAGVRHAEHERVCEKAYLANLELKDKAAEYRAKFELFVAENKVNSEVKILFQSIMENNKESVKSQERMTENMRSVANQIIEKISADGEKTRDTVQEEADKTREEINIVINSAAEKMIKNMGGSDWFPQIDAAVYNTQWCTKYLCAAKCVPLDGDNIKDFLTSMLESDGNFAGILQNAADNDHKYALNFINRIGEIITGRLYSANRAESARAIEHFVYNLINCNSSTKRIKL